MSKLGKFAAACAAVLCAFSVSVAQATDYYVAKTGADENPGTVEEPFATIAAAIGAAQEDGDVIHVGPGDYNEWGLTIEKAIRIEGEAGSVIYGFETPYAGTGRRIFYMTADATIANLTIKNGGFQTDGKDANGGNVFMNAGTITNCVIEGGYVVHSTDAGIKGALGGNLYMRGGLVVDCEIKDGGIYNGNGAGGGGNVMMYGGGRLMRCKVTGARRTSGSAASYTTESGGSGIYMNGAATVENCLISGNSGTYGAVAMVGAARLVNCTVAGNSGGYNGYNGVILKDSNPWVVNCVIDDNGGEAKNEWGDANAARFVNCAMPQEMPSGENCVWIKNDVTTTFADTVNYRPTVNAEFIDRGSAVQYAAYALSATDLDGRVRSVGGIDIGAYEYDSGSARVSDHKSITGRALTFMVGSLTDGLTYVWDFGNGERVPAETLSTEYAFPTAGVFTVSLVAYEDDVPVSAYSLMKPVVVKPNRVYVDAANENPVAPYDAPEKACASFMEAFASVCDEHGDIFLEGITIEVAPGTYDAVNVTLDKCMTICGSGASPDAAVLRANESPTHSPTGRRVFRLLADATIANLTICNGAIETPGTDENGGNVFMKAGTITNCVIRDGFVLHNKDATINGALGGNVYMLGGLVIDSTIDGGCVQNVVGAGGGGNVVLYGGGARLVRCRVTGACRTGGGNGQHTMESGGSGVYMNGDTTMENCLVTRNGSSFGAVSLIGAAKVVNCTIAGNTGNYEGHNGIYMRDGNPIVVNTIIVGDATAGGSWGGSYGGRFFNSASSAEIVGGTACVHLLGQSSGYFEDDVDFRPLLASGLLNKGSDSLYAQYTQSELDLDRATRAVDVIDIGCYETATSGFSCRGSVNAQNARRGQALTFEVETIGADDVDISWDFGNGETLATTDKAVRYAFQTCGVYTVSLTVDAGDKGSEQITLQPITVVTDVLYVDGANASPEYPYDTPARAATSIKTALTAIKDEKGGMLADDVVVHVASGTYTESGIAADRPVRIVGEGANRDAVVVQANENPHLLGAGRVFTLQGGGLLCNLTVRNGCYTTVGTDINGGNVYMGNGGVVSNCVIAAGHMEHTCDGKLNGVLGGNLYLFGATAVDCVIRDGTIYNENGAGGGGNVVAAGTGSISSGLALTGPSRMLRCRVTGARRFSGEPLSPAGNSGGSGICAIGDAVIENCLVADNAGGYAAVMLKDGARIVQSTVAGNHDNYLGRDGIVMNVTSCSALNTAMYNSATNAAAEWGNASGAKFENCASPVEITGGSGCIVLPQSRAATFRDETTYRLSASSPLRDAGSCYLGPDRSLYGVDLRHRPRFVGKAPDIGCYESAGGLMLLVK